MKKIFFLALAVSCISNSLSAQVCTTEDFSSKKATGWTLSQGARLADYNNPKNNCAEERGIITPGVGGNNPCNIKTPTYTATGAPTIKVSFDILVFDANLKCNTWKDFGCETSIDVFYFVGNTKYTGIIDQVLPANGPLGTTLVNFVMPVGSNLPAGTAYEIQIEFKPKSGTGNCVQQNTKYIIDNFVKCDVGVISLTEGPTKTNANQSDISVYPNPSNGSTALKVKAAIAYDKVEILDQSGKVIRTDKITNSEINIEGLSKGVYTVRLGKEGTDVSALKKITIN